MGPEGELHTLAGIFCHRDPGRTLSLQGHPLLLCARCTGVYLAALVGVSLAALPNRRPQWIDGRLGLGALLLLAAPLALDVLSVEAGLRATSNGVRLVTGCTYGLVVGVALAMGLGRARRPSARGLMTLLLVALAGLWLLAGRPSAPGPLIDLLIVGGLSTVWLLGGWRLWQITMSRRRDAASE